MATHTQSAIPARAEPNSSTGLVSYRLTVARFLKMIDAGIFQDEEDIELLAGRLIQEMTKDAPHDFAVTSLAQKYRGILGPSWIVREEKSVVLGRYWRPEPDLTALRGPLDRYRTRAPRPADIGLLAEVADSTYAKDRGLKWTKYAACKGASDWIVNIPERRVEAYSSPTGRGNAARYQGRRDYGTDDKVPVIVEGRELGRIKLSEIL